MRLDKRIASLEQGCWASVLVVRLFQLDGSTTGPTDAELQARRQAGEVRDVIDVRIVNEPRRQR